MLGAPGSLASCALLPTHEPLVKTWRSDWAAGTIFRLAPLATVTHDCIKVVEPVCTVPFTQLPPPPPPPPPLGVLVAVLPPPVLVVVVVPGRTQAASKILPSASTASIMTTALNRLLLIVLLPLKEKFSSWYASHIRNGSTRSYSDRQRALKWVLLVTVPRTVLDATASLRTASFRQDQRQYCVLLESQLANGLRPSCKPACQRTAFFLKAVLPTDCVLAPLRQDARSALRSGKLQGVRFAQASCKECASLSRSE